MKLSKKGQFKLADYKCAYGAYVAGLSEYAPDWPKFEPEDFKGVVALTNKEAAEILDFLSYLSMRSYRDSFLDGLDECCKKLKDRIGQSKMAIASTYGENMSKKDKNFVRYDDSNILSKLRQSICLTVDEAKQVQRAIVLARYLTKSIDHEEELSNLFDQIDDRIKQAEMSMPST